MGTTKIRRALISVYDKTGIVDFARALQEEFGIEIISTGGTARTLREAGIPVTLVEDITGFPEMMDGRVKTLHPKIHAAILADRDNPEHMRQLAEQGIEPIDMVVVNLYPFEKTIADPDCTLEQALEMIDIGGPCLLRAAAKTHRHVLVVSDPILYKLTLIVVKEQGAKPDQLRRKILAFNAFARTTGYDGEIASWLSRPGLPEPPTFRSLRFCEGEETSYGENPHQTGAVLNAWDTARGHRLIGAAREDTLVDMSFNNYADASAALELCKELTWAGEGLWHRFPTGEVSHRFPTGDQPRPRTPDKRVDKRIEDERATWRNLAHIQKPQATYFITFRLRSGELSPDERTIVLDACRYWHGRKMTLHAAVVMPDHAHLLLTPHEIEPDRWVSLGELLHSIKRHSAHQINMQRGATGALWQDESFDRVVRDESEFREKWEYIEANPITEGIADGPGYPWFWRSGAGFMQVEIEGVEEGTRRLETGATDHRLETGATDHRLETGATSIQDAAFLSTCCFIKHTNACGVGIADQPIEAYRRAYLGDPNAAMGGILAVNFEVDVRFAEAVMETYSRWGKQAGAGGFFVEVWVAPAFDEAAVEVIRSKKKWGERARLLEVGDMNVEPDPDEMDYKRIAGGMLVQTRDLVGLNEDQWKVVTEKQPTEAQMDDLRLAWLVCKHTKSNAISICADGMLIGNGAGQMSRVMSCRIATWLAKDNGHEEKLKGAAAASDAFFPFRDGPDILADAGVTALIQPGGSKRDQQVIDAANQRGLAMIFTGTRHFKH